MQRLKMMIELNAEESQKLISMLKQEIQTDLVVKLTEKLERGESVHEAAVRGFQGEGLK